MEAIAANILLEGLAVNALAQCETPVTLVTTDSREVCPGCIFVAFPGEKFDGHDFAAKALENGALCVVLNHPVEGVPEEKSVICPDSYHAMMVMGANYRSQFHPKVVGVTGSVGKTTTKQMTYAAIAGFGDTIKTEGNQNNELGLPRTLFRIGKETEYAVVEMGMSHAGEIERLARCARPDVGIITCIGVSHIGNLGSQENICKAKLEICNGLPEGAPLVLNYDDPFLRKAVLPAHVRPVWFSLSDENADVCALSIRQETNGMSFVLEDQEHGTFVVNIPAMGRHNVANALAAYCAATRLGCDALDGGEIGRLAGLGPLQIHEMEVGGPGGFKLFHGVQRVRVVDRHLVVVPLVQAHSLAAEEVDGGKNVHLTSSLRRMFSGWPGPHRRSFPGGTDRRTDFLFPQKHRWKRHTRFSR